MSFRDLITLTLVIGGLAYWLGGWAAGAPTPVATVVPAATMTIAVTGAAPTPTPTLMPPASVTPTPDLWSVVPERVEFVNGSYGATVEGQLDNGRTIGYVLWARGGQVMRLAGTGSARLTVQHVGSGRLGLRDAALSDTAALTLPVDGDYVVYVYGGQGSYQLGFEIR